MADFAVGSICTGFVASAMMGLGMSKMGNLIKVFTLISIINLIDILLPAMNMVVNEYYN